MNYASEGLLANAQSIAYQNQAATDKLNPEFPDMTFLSKGELKKLIESLCWEIAKLKQKNNDLVEGQIKLREEIQICNRKISHYQDQYLEAIGEVIKKQDLSKICLRITG